MASDDPHVPGIILHGPISLLSLDAIGAQERLKAVIHGQAWLKTGLEGAVKLFSMGQEVVDLQQHLPEDKRKSLTRLDWYSLPDG